MKVLHVYKTYFPDTVGGIEKTISQIALSEALLEVDTEVLTMSPTTVEETIKIDNHYVHRCRSNFEIASTPFSASAFLRFRQLAKGADIIHYHFPYPFADLLHFITRVNKPTVLTYHSDIVRQIYLLRLYQPLMHKFLGSVDRIVSTSPSYLKSSKPLAKFRDKVSVIPIGLDKSTYSAANKERLEYWQKKFGDKFFLFIGVLRYYKGLHILIEAACNSDYLIIIVGAGPIEKELKDQVKNLGIKNIYFVGFVSDEDKVALFTLSYATLLPSHLRSEAFGISLLEGAMYSKPLISCEIGTGTTYINIDGETGIVVPPSNPDALRKAMDYLWNNPRIAKKMGERAEKRYWNLFTADRMAKSYVDLYQNLLDE
jgi:glycosyltransferase involved in cell wall biosynthesis